MTVPSPLHALLQSAQQTEQLQMHHDDADATSTTSATTMFQQTASGDSECNMIACPRLRPHRKRQRQQQHQTRTQVNTQSHSQPQAHTTTTAMLLVIVAVLFTSLPTCAAFTSLGGHSVLQGMGNTNANANANARVNGIHGAARYPSHHRGTFVTLSQSTSSTENASVTMIEPKTQVSDAKRKVAVAAMQRKEVRRKISSMESETLGMLADACLFPDEGISEDDDAVGVPRIRQSTSNYLKSKPQGRPNLVPGAMTRRTMAKFRRRQHAIDRLEEVRGDLGKEEMATISKFINGDADELSSSIDDNGNGDSAAGKSSAQPSPASAKKVRGSSRKPKRDIKDISKDKESTTNTKAVGPKKRKRVHKNLPKPRPKGATVSAALKRNRNIPGNMELQKYYNTELLTPEDEYTLGMQVKFMMQCESVHEGLATALMRVPTIEEWAAACGFEDADPDFRATEFDDQIRPKGYDSMFQKVDPNMFVGNGLAHSAGVGRGRGRQKKAPPTKLTKFYVSEPVKTDGDTGDNGDGETKKNKKKRVLVNTGTASQFVDSMIEAKEAKQRMVQCNMRLVVSIARKYCNVGVGLQDLVQEGSLGLSRAAEKFDPAKGFKFSTYASWWIQQSVFRSIAYHSRTIRLPVHVHNLLSKVRKEKNTLQAQLGRMPTNEEMAAALEMPLPKYNNMLRLTKRSISLEVPKYQNNVRNMGLDRDDVLGDGLTTSDDVDQDSPPTKIVDRSLFHDDLGEMLKALTEEERTVISYRYGLTDGLTRTVTIVAAIMKQSKPWVRSQECRALRKLRRPWYEKKLKEHQEALSA